MQNKTYKNFIELTIMKKQQIKKYPKRISQFQNQKLKF